MLRRAAERAKSVRFRRARAQGRGEDGGRRGWGGGRPACARLDVVPRARHAKGVIVGFHRRGGTLAELRAGPLPIAIGWEAAAAVAAAAAAAAAAAPAATRFGTWFSPWDIVSRWREGGESEGEGSVPSARMCGVGGDMTDHDVSCACCSADRALCNSRTTCMAVCSGRTAAPANERALATLRPALEGRSRRPCAEVGPVARTPPCASLLLRVPSNEAACWSSIRVMALLHGEGCLANC